MSEDIFDRNEELCGVLQHVSGQLRNSLGNIYTALERLAPPSLRDEDSKTDMNAAVLCQSFYRILRLADNLEEAVHLDGPSASVLENGDIAQLCQCVADRAQQPASLLGLKLLYRCSKSRHIILMDSRRIERLIMNLLSNAFKFTPSGGQVILELRIGPEWVELSVSDTGSGIPAELRDTVFDRYRHTERLDPPPHGLGLGLPICRQIAQEHGGQILLTSSKEGEGTTFTVSLPNKWEKVRQLKAPSIVYSSTFNLTLEELSDALPKEAFTQKLLD